MGCASDRRWVTFQVGAGVSWFLEDGLNACLQGQENQRPAALCPAFPGKTKLPCKWQKREAPTRWGKHLLDFWWLNWSRCIFFTWACSNMWQQAPQNQMDPMVYHRFIRIFPMNIAWHRHILPATHVCWPLHRGIVQALPWSTGWCLQRSPDGSWISERSRKLVYISIHLFIPIGIPKHTHIIIIIIIINNTYMYIIYIYIHRRTPTHKGYTHGKPQTTKPLGSSKCTAKIPRGSQKPKTGIWISGASGIFFEDIVLAVHLDDLNLTIWRHLVLDRQILALHLVGAFKPPKISIRSELSSQIG